MKILAIDIGTGTQDILLFDSAIEIENCLQLVMPSPTALVASKVRRATASGEAVLLTGTIMGGGPSAWAAEDHARVGLPIYATPEAAKSFNDELDQVEKSGIRIVSEEEACRLEATRVELRDVDLEAIRHAFKSFGVRLELDALAVAVFDHGNSPPGYSDRLFRFDFIADRLGSGQGLAGFAFRREEIPERLTRFRAVAASVPSQLALLVMDTAPAAVLGALDDERVMAHPSAVIANLGNFHTLAFRFSNGAITGVFEHHTGELNKAQLEGFIQALAAGTLRHEEVFNSQGHGALVLDPRSEPLDFLAVTGPRRSLLLGSRLNPYFAVPYGDMMMAGNYGLLRAFAAHAPEWRDEIERPLNAGRKVT